jgi:prolyl oligopeptidase
MSNVMLPTVAAPDDDPWLWLEDVEGERALAFVAEQNARTLARYGGPKVESDAEVLAAILDRPDNLPIVTRRVGLLYNYWKDATNPRGLWRRTTLDSFRTTTPQWETVLDLDALAAAEKEDWIWGGAGTLPPMHDRALLRLSRGGSDAVVLREFDIGTRTFVAGGFELPEAKGGAAWVDLDTLLVSTALGEGMATTSGYARTVRLWRRGTDFSVAPIVFETTPQSMSAWADVDRSVTPHRVWWCEMPSFFELRVHRDDGNNTRTLLDLPLDVSLSVRGDWLAVRRRSEWTVGGKTHPADTLLGMRLSRFLAGGRDFTVLFTPAARRALEYFTWVGERLLVSSLDDLSPRFALLTPADSEWRSEPVPGLPEVGVVDVWSLDHEAELSNGDLLSSVQDPLMPPTLSLIEQGKAPAILKQGPRVFDPSGLVVTRHEAVSVDGERIPYVQVGPAAETGDAPVHLSGYGGFRVTTKPYYRAGAGKLWLERGGTVVTANIRGGGEFGSAWHEAGRRAGKRLSHDDFAAVAADLVRRGVTRPQRIAAEGGSNGGILITNMLVRYPERFGALFCTIPLIDMRRYTRLLAGASWIAEYGDPDKPEDWAFLQTYSAYHMAEPGKSYPPILIATTRRDDRVHPGHARKMAAKLQAMGYDASFYEPAAGGHGYGKDNKERAMFTALGLAFLAERIGWRGRRPCNHTLPNRRVP